MKLRKSDEYFRTAHLEEGMRRRSMRAGTITLLSQGGLFTLGIMSTMILARILRPVSGGPILGRSRTRLLHTGKRLASRADQPSSDTDCRCRRLHTEPADRSTRTVSRLLSTGDTDRRASRHTGSLLLPARRPADRSLSARRPVVSHNPGTPVSGARRLCHTGANGPSLGVRLSGKRRPPVPVGMFLSRRHRCRYLPGDSLGSQRRGSRLLHREHPSDPARCLVLLSEDTASNQGSDRRIFSSTHGIPDRDGVPYRPSSVIHTDCRQHDPPHVRCGVFLYLLSDLPAYYSGRPQGCDRLGRAIEGSPAIVAEVTDEKDSDAQL